MIPNLLYSGCGLCYQQEYDTQIKEDVKDMKQEDKAIRAWKSKTESSVSSKDRRLLQKSRSSRGRFAGHGDEDYSLYSAQTSSSSSPPSSYRLRPRKHGRGRYEASTVSTPIRRMQTDNNLLQRNLRAAQKELLVQDKMIIQLESDLQVSEIEHAKLEDKMYLLQLDLEDARTALRREVLRNQENERLLQEYGRLEEEQRQILLDQEAAIVQNQRYEEEEERQDESSWFWSWK